MKQQTKTMSISACLKASCQKYRKKIAISFIRENQTEIRLSFSQLDSISNQIANMLVKRGIKKSDNIVLLCNKSLIFIVIHIALQKIGAVCVPLNPGFKKFELEYLLNDADPALVIINPDKMEIIKQINPDLDYMVFDTDIPFHKIDFFKSFSDYFENIELSPDNPALIIYTSGTTGNPKGAVLTQKNLIHDAENIIKIWEISDSDTIMHALPLFHVHGLCFALHTALMAGSHVVMTDKFIPDVVLDILAKNTGDMVCSVFMGVPAMYSALMDCIKNKKLYNDKNLSCNGYEHNLTYLQNRPASKNRHTAKHENHYRFCHNFHINKKGHYNFDHIRLWTSGSAPLLSKDFHKIKQIFGKEPVEREGMSETGMNFSNPLHKKKKPGSIGIPLPGLRVRIVNPDTFLDVKPGQIGEFWLKSDSIIQSYWKKREETKKAFKDGWFRTGDLGKKDEDGYYYITDRVKNIIITGGENVSPNEIETIINLLDDVVESAVTGIEDDKWGEKIVAAVVKAPGTGDISHDIKAICKKHLHNLKCPKEIIFVEKLPRNTMGKILKKEVKKLF